MKFIIMSLMVLGSLSSWAESAPDAKVDRDPASKESREASKKQIFDGCMTMSPQVIDVKKKICECYVENFEMKLGDSDLALMAKSYTPDAKGKAPNVKMSEVLTYFDYDVATHCTDDSKWRIEIDPEDK